ncbi:MAG: serine hydrolase [Rubrobacteraceae bacterium]
MTPGTSSVGVEDRTLDSGEVGQQPRLGRRITVYALAAALLLGLGVTGLAFASSMERLVVQTVETPVAGPPDPAPSAPAPSEPPPPEPVAREAIEEKDPEAPGNPAALEERINEITQEYGGVYGVVVSDPASGETVSLGADETFFAASIGKLPTLLSLYKSAAQGTVDLDDEITMLASDVQGYGTGVLHDREVGYTLTLRECAFYMMNESDNTAWEMLTRYLGEEKIQGDVASLGAYDTEYWAPNTTTADDVLLMLKTIADPSFTSPELSEEMLYSMTDTVSEDRITGGLPPDVRVAHKIGTYENNFSDAGIVYYGDGSSEEHYFIVVFTDELGEMDARAAIQEMAAAAHRTFGPDSGS